MKKLALSFVLAIALASCTAEPLTMESAETVEITLSTQTSKKASTPVHHSPSEIKKVSDLLVYLSKKDINQTIDGIKYLWDCKNLKLTTIDNYPNSSHFQSVVYELNQSSYKGGLKNCNLFAYYDINSEYNQMDVSSALISESKGDIENEKNKSFADIDTLFPNHPSVEIMHDSRDTIYMYQMTVDSQNITILINISDDVIPMSNGMNVYQMFTEIYVTPVVE